MKEYWRVEKWAAVFGLQISDVALNAIFRAMAAARVEVYEHGDFIAYSEGMGEIGHGMVIRDKTIGYAVRPYFNGEPMQFTTLVGVGDVQGLRTLKQAAEYERVRGGG